MYNNVPMSYLRMQQKGKNTRAQRQRHYSINRYWHFNRFQLRVQFIKNLVFQLWTHRFGNRAMSARGLKRILLTHVRNRRWSERGGHAEAGKCSWRTKTWIKRTRIGTQDCDTFSGRCKSNWFTARRISAILESQIATPTSVSLPPSPFRSFFFSRAVSQSKLCRFQEADRRY